MAPVEYCHYINMQILKLCNFTEKESLMKGILPSLTNLTIESAVINIAYYVSLCLSFATNRTSEIYNYQGQNIRNAARRQK